MRRSLCAWMARNLGGRSGRKLGPRAGLGAYALGVATCGALRYAVRLDDHVRDGNTQKIAPTRDGPGHTSRRTLVISRSWPVGASLDTREEGCITSWTITGTAPN